MLKLGIIISSKIGTNNIEINLKKWLSKAQKVVIAGIGNPLRRDDFVGIKIVGNLQGKVSKRICLIECETIPESFFESITEFAPTHILIVDAASIDMEPGSSRLISPDHIVNRPAISTHALPLQVFCRYLAEATRAKIAILIIQPEDVSFGEGLTIKVEKTATNLARLLSKILP